MKYESMTLRDKIELLVREGMSLQEKTTVEQFIEKFSQDLTEQLLEIVQGEISDRR